MNAVAFNKGFKSVATTINVTKSTAGAIGSAAKWLGNKVAKGACATGRGVAKGACATGRGAKHLGSAVATGAVATGDATGSFVKGAKFAILCHGINAKLICKE